MKAGFEVELATALREEVLETFAEQVHHHDVISLAVFSLLVTNEVKEWDMGLASKLVD